jgi:hypothetical protein
VVVGVLVVGGGVVTLVVAAAVGATASIPTTIDAIQPLRIDRK